MEKELRVLRTLGGIARTLEMQGQRDVAEELDNIRRDLLERYEALFRDAASDAPFDQAGDYVWNFDEANA